jgi:SNF2 family DNA or RNA helicase
MTPKIEDLDKALKRSSKMKAMMDILEGTAGKVVVFSQYERAVSLACRAFEKANPPIEYVRYTGEENEKARNLALEKFSKDPDVKVMIMTTSAGGLGLTLTEAPDAIFLDKMWNPEDNVQAEDRIHRMGQLSDNIVIHEILAEDTLDEWVENILNTKTSIDASVMDMMNKYHGSELIQVLKGVSAGKGVPTNLHTLNTVNHMKVKPQLNLPKNPHKQTYEGIQESK